MFLLVPFVNADIDDCRIVDSVLNPNNWLYNNQIEYRQYCGAAPDTSSGFPGIIYGTPLYNCDDEGVMTYYISLQDDEGTSGTYEQQFPNCKDVETITVYLSDVRQKLQDLGTNNWPSSEEFCLYKYEIDLTTAVTPDPMFISGSYKKNMIVKGNLVDLSSLFTEGVKSCDAEKTILTPLCNVNDLMSVAVDNNWDDVEAWLIDQSNLASSNGDSYSGCSEGQELFLLSGSGNTHSVFNFFRDENSLEGFPISGTVNYGAIQNNPGTEGMESTGNNQIDVNEYCDCPYTYTGAQSYLIGPPYDSTILAPQRSCTAQVSYRPAGKAAPTCNAMLTAAYGPAGGPNNIIYSGNVYCHGGDPLMNDPAYYREGMFDIIDGYNLGYAPLLEPGNDLWWYYDGTNTYNPGAYMVSSVDTDTYSSINYLNLDGNPTNKLSTCSISYQTDLYVTDEGSGIINLEPIYDPMGYGIMTTKSALFYYRNENTGGFILIPEEAITFSQGSFYPYFGMGTATNIKFDKNHASIIAGTNFDYQAKIQDWAYAQIVDQNGDGDNERMDLANLYMKTPMIGTTRVPAIITTGPSNQCVINLVNVSQKDYGANCEADQNLLCDKGDKVGFRITTNNHPDCSLISHLRVDFSSASTCSIGPDLNDEYPVINITLTSGLSASTDVSYALTADIPASCMLQTMVPDFAQGRSTKGPVTASTLGGSFVFGANYHFSATKATISGVACSGPSGTCQQGDTVRLSIEFPPIGANPLLFNSASVKLSDGSTCTYYFNDYTDTGDTEFVFSRASPNNFNFNPANCVTASGRTTCEMTKTISNPIKAECAGKLANLESTLLLHTSETLGLTQALHQAVPIAYAQSNEGSIPFAAGGCVLQPGPIGFDKSACTEGTGNECWTGDIIDLSFLVEETIPGGCANLAKGIVTSQSVTNNFVECNLGDVGGLNLSVNPVGGNFYLVRGNFAVKDMLSSPAKDCQNVLLNLSRVSVVDNANNPVLDISVADKQLKFWVGQCRMADTENAFWGSSSKTNAFLSTKLTSIASDSYSLSTVRKRVNFGNTLLPTEIFKGLNEFYGTNPELCYSQNATSEEFVCDPDDDLAIATRYSGDCSEVASVEVGFDFAASDNIIVSGTSLPFTFSTPPAQTLGSAAECFPNGGKLIINSSGNDFNSPLYSLYTRSGVANLLYKISWIPDSCLNKRLVANTLTFRDASNNVIDTRTITHNQIIGGNGWEDPGTIKFGPIGGYDAEKYCGAIYTDDGGLLADRSCNMHSPLVATYLRPNGAKCPTENHCLWSKDPGFNGQALPILTDSNFWNSVECVPPGTRRSTTMNGTTFDVVCMGQQVNGTEDGTAWGAETYAKPWCPAWDSSDGTNDDSVWELLVSGNPQFGGVCRKRTAICDQGYSSLNTPANPWPVNILTCDAPINQTIKDLSVGGSAEKCFDSVLPDMGITFPKVQVCCPFFTVPGPSGPYEFYQDEAIKIY